MLDALKKSRDKLDSIVMFANKENERRSELEAEYIKNQNKLEQLSILERENDYCLNVVLNKAVSYRDSTVTFIEDRITSSLGRAFPNEKYSAKIRFGVSRNKDTAELKLIRLGKEYIVALNGGRLSQQLVSCSAVTAINSIRGSKMLYLDEALASSDVDTVKDLSPMVKNLVDDGFQVILIEHKENLYNNITRRQHHFVKTYPDLSGRSGVTTEDYIEEEVGVN